MTMTYPKTYMRMSEVALRKLLSQRKLPMGVAEGIIAQVVADRKNARPALKKDEQHRRLWGDLISPAKSERRIVQRMLTLKLEHGSPERTLALEAYLMVLDAIIGRLLLQARNTDEMPRQVALGTNVPNKGEHWVDWMPKKKIALIEQYFADIPHVRGVRQKTPFERRIPPDQHAKHKQRLIERTKREMEHIERSLAVELADTKLTDHHYFKQQEIEAMRVQVSRMQAALHIIGQLPANAFIPTTWHGITLPD